MNCPCCATPEPLAPGDPCAACGASALVRRLYREQKDAHSAEKARPPDPRDVAAPSNTRIDLGKLFRGVHLLRWYANTPETRDTRMFGSADDHEAFQLALTVLALLDDALDVRDIPASLRKPDDATMALALFAEEVIAATVTLSAEPAVVESFRRFVKDARERAAERAAKEGSAVG